jgi:hypothetical protein
MRRALVIPLAAACFATAAPAVAGDPPFLSVKPRPVHLDHTVTIKGRQWFLNEFCKPRVRLRLESDQNAVLIGFARIGDNGRFTRHWTPETGKIYPGRWRHVARRPCESGQDGSTIFITRRRSLRILR